MRTMARGVQWLGLMTASNQITRVSGKNSDGTEWHLSIGDRVDIAADPTDDDSVDTGYIVSFPSQGYAIVDCGGYATEVGVESLTHA